VSGGSGLSFAESAALLAIAALLTGVLAPFIVQWATRRRLREQKRYEEDLARESAFISAQAELLQTLGAALWAYQAKGLAVSYAGASAPARFDEEWQAYDRESFALLAEVDTRLSMAGTLFSPETVRKLRDFYDDWLLGTFDREISSMARRGVDQATWKRWHNPHHQEVGERTTRLLAEVADDAGLSFERRRRPL
jgi:hypothetical protein